MRPATQKAINAMMATSNAEREEDINEKLMLKSFECEQRRYESMLSTAGRMIAGLSLIFVALATLLPLLLEKLSLISTAVVAESLLVFLLLLVSLLFAILSQFRRGYNALANPKEILSKFNENKARRNGEIDSYEWLAGSLGSAFKGLRDLTDWIGIRLRLANVILFIALSLIILFVLIDAIVYLSLVS